MERDGSKEPVPYNGIGSGPSLPRRVLPLGLFPQRPCHRGSPQRIPLSEHMRQAPRKRSGPAAHFMGYHSTTVRILQGGCGGGPGLRRPPAEGRDGFVLACALHQRRVWLGGRRCPTGPPSNVIGNRGTPPVPPAGAQPPAPAGNGAGVAFHLGASGSNEALLSSPGGESGSSVAGGRFLTTQRPRGTLVSGQWLGAAGPTDGRGGSEQTWGI